MSLHTFPKELVKNFLLHTTAIKIHVDLKFITPCIIKNSSEEMVATNISFFFFYHKSVKYNRTKINLITSSSGSRYSLIVLDLLIKSFNSSSFTCLHNGQVFLPRYVEYTCMYITNYTIFPTRPTIKKLLGSRSLICL